ncbi:hypothetical protein [Caproicibacter sp. BJN0012]|uniref:hypothetical protein n=1 Tax=Caproicibacter sp. BJN0012 TaxID=3110227 RepID=UPI002E14C6B7
MPENLRITAPVPNSDGILKPNPSAQSSPVEPMEPARVNRPNAQDQNTDSASLNLLLGKNSVFGKFIQQLRQTPALSETLGKLLFTAVRKMEASPSSLPESSVLRELASGLTAEQEDLVKSLISQQKGSSLFSGPLFQLLGRISEQAGDPQLDLRVASFLKAFDGFFSVKDTTAAIASNLDRIGRQIPAGDAKQLALLAEKLNTADPERLLGSNLNLLKKEILPFLSAYVSKSSDYGEMRETISLLLQNASILNISSRENLEAQYRRLVSYCDRRVGEPMLRLMRSFYEEAVSPERGKTENHFFRSLVSLLSQGGGSDAPETDKAVYADISRSLLLDNSVYMPFTHILLPAVVQGRFLFAQIWIEKKGSREEERAPAGKTAEPIRLYLTFTIQDLGYFEARVELTGKKVDLALSCPEKLLAKRGPIASSLGQILVKNGLASGDIRLSCCEKPEVPDLIVRKIMERKRTVDVTI